MPRPTPEQIAKLAPRTREVFEVLNMSTEAMTMGEVFEFMKVLGYDMLGFNENLTSRANDLERLGFIRRGAKRVCALSGVKATAWSVNEGEVIAKPKRTGQMVALRDVLDAAREVVAMGSAPTPISLEALKVLVEAADRVLA